LRGVNRRHRRNLEKGSVKYVSCQACPLRALPLFITHSSTEVALIESMKREQVVVQADRSIIHEGQKNAALFTLLSGWAFRFKTLSDGRRQILNFLLPGDFIGVQQKMGDASAHGVQALTDTVLCVFQRNSLWDLHRSAPDLGFAVTWLTAHEESLVDDTLLSVGRRSAEERIATLLVVLYKRAAALSPDFDSRLGVPFPLTQRHIADGLGLSLVHTNKTLRKLERKGLHRIEGGRLYLLDAHTMARIGDLYGDGKPAPRPLI
jgi:CRP-like cAMP-binding protein